MNVDFYSELLAHLPIYLGWSVMVGLILYFLFRRQIFSIFDPLFFVLVVYEVCCISDVIFMYQYGLIAWRYFLNFMLTEAAFFLGILLIRPGRPRPLPGPSFRVHPDAFRLAYLVSVVLLIGLNLVVYATRGIPLFAASRLATYSAGGGWGLISRLFDVLPVIIVFYLFDLLSQRNWRMGEWAVLAIVFIIQVLSGAKNAALNLLFMAALYAYYARPERAPGRRDPMKRLKRLALGALVGLFIVAGVQSTQPAAPGTVQMNLLGQIALRFVNAGDAFVFSYPGGLIENLETHHDPVGNLFNEFTDFIKITTPPKTPRHLGAQLTTLFHGPSDVPTQTNAKHNMFGYVNFGFWGAVLYSFLIGLSLGLVRYRMPYLLPHDWVWGIAYVIMNLGFINIGTELDGAIRAMISVMFFFLPFVVLMLSLERFVRPRRAASVSSA